MGSKDGLQPIEKTVIDRCVHQIYQNTSVIACLIQHIDEIRVFEVAQEKEA